MEGYADGKLASVRNPEGIWINTEVFREEAKKFKRYGEYCPDPWGSPDWFAYWQEQRRRCRDGYTVGGVKITGDHYTYLNFCPIQKTEDQTKKKSKKVTDFPDFWDGDYNYFWVREIARHGILDPLEPDEEKREATLKLDDIAQAFELKKLFESLHLEVKIEVDYLTGGFNLIVGKSRRKGYSFKNAAVAVANYICRPKSVTMFGAYTKDYLYPKGIFTMAMSYINFISLNTPWSYPRDFINKPGQGHIKASTLEYRNGVAIEVGFQSEIIAQTFKDNPDAARGKDLYDLVFEESGAFGTPGLLKDAYKASEDCVMDGAIKTGMITIFGTSGDMEGGTADYADMHSRPLAFGLLPFQNIWDEDAEDSKCGFFHPIHWNMPGFYDEQGNSDTEGAIKEEKAIRKVLIDNGASSIDIQKRGQEKPFGPFEAFGTVSLNNFPVLELKKRLDYVTKNNIHLKKGTPVNLYYNSEKGKVVAEPILDGSAHPIWKMKPDDITKVQGCPVIYEYPSEVPVLGAYKIGYDPYRQDKGTSLSAIYVYKSVIIGERTKRVIVAEFVGRPNETDDCNQIARYFAELYNTKIMHENEVTHVKDFFRRRKLLHLLAYQPDEVIKKSVKNSRVNRIFGCHMNEQLKDAGEKYIKDWLTDVLDYDEEGKPITVIDQIDSPGLLEELIAYHRKGNFDRVMALMQVMFQDQEDMYGKTFEKERKPKQKFVELVEMLEEMPKVRKNTLFS